MKKKHPLWLILPAFVLAMIVGCIFWLRIPTSYRAMTLLKQTWDSKTMSGTANLKFDAGSGEASFSWNEINGERYYRIELAGESLFIHRDDVWFDNGRGYDLSSMREAFGWSEKYDLKVLLLAGFEKTVLEDGASYQAQLNGQQFKSLSSADSESASLIQDCILTLTEQNGRLTGLTLTSGSSWIELRLFDDPGITIPTEILMEIGASEPIDIRTLQPLFAAGRELLSRDTFGGDVQLDVSCGPLSISDTAQLFGTGDGVFYVRGEHVLELYSESLSSDPTLLLGLGCTLCKEGIWESAGADSGTFLLTIDPASMDEILLSVLPELEGLGISLTEGIMTLTIEQNRIAGLTLSCRGDMPVLITTIPLELNVALERMEDPVTLPAEIG